MQATTARRVREADFTEEPNVKLSNAFIVVLLLHVVAVGGIYAFNALKEHQPAAYEETETPPVAATPAMPAAQPVASAAPIAATPPAPLYYRVKSGDTIMHIATTYGIGAEALIDLNDLRTTGGIHVGQDLKLPPGASLAGEQPQAPLAVKDSGNIYTVIRGDTPQGIARKLHVLYADLIRLNNIEDPRKLKPGEKLKVPVRHATA